MLESGGVDSGVARVSAAGAALKFAVPGDFSVTPQNFLDDFFLSLSMFRLCMALL